MLIGIRLMRRKLNDGKFAQRMKIYTWPKSLKAEWEEQIAKFSDLSFLAIHGMRKEGKTASLTKKPH